MLVLLGLLQELQPKLAASIVLKRLKAPKSQERLEAKKCGDM